MLVFLTSIRHPYNSNNFNQVEYLFELSLRSVCSQSDPNFKVIVVCNQLPRISYSDSRVIYHVVDFPPPSEQRNAEIDINALLRDKGTKLMSGILRARVLNPSYFMIFDADDLVSRRLASFVNTHPNTPGWYIDAGYAINYNTRRIQRKYGMVRFCGTSLVPNANDIYRLSGVTDSLPDDASQQELINATPRHFIDNVIGNHKYMPGYFARHGRFMRPLPFRAAAWLQETGENQTISKGNATGLPLTPWILNELGITVPGINIGARATISDRLFELIDCSKSWLGSLSYRYLQPDLPHKSQ